MTNLTGAGPIPIHLRHTFSIRFINLGLGRCRLFHLWEKAEFLGADDWRTVDDRRVVFRRVCAVDVADRSRVNGRDLRSIETRLLTAG